MAERESIIVRFEGDAGDGVISMGMIAARVAARLGYHVYTYSTFLAAVRGGPSNFQLRIGRRPLLSQGDQPDILVALNQQAVKNNGYTVPAGGLILHPPFDEPIDEDVNKDAQVATVDFKSLAIEHGGSPRGLNIVASGLAMSLLGLNMDMAAAVVADMWKKKGPEVEASNRRSLEAGFAMAGKINGHSAEMRVAPPDEAKPRLLMSGNEAMALGALAAGVRFFAGYPITPASEVMQWLAEHLPRVGGRMVQAEDEISALAMCIGASFGGVKSMTATSGPGLSLMVELIGLASMTETPVVIVDVQRAGPSTGMPTKEGQGDLNLAVFGVHGEAPRVVLAPQSVSGCFEQAIRAVNIAHEFHVPVIVLSSQSLSHRMQTIEMPDLKNLEIYEELLFQGTRENAEPVPFERFANAPEGRASVRSVPGTPGGMYRASGLEHDEFGNPSTDPKVRTRMVRRRRERMHAIEKAFQNSVEEDCRSVVSSPLGLISWGTTASVARETIEVMRKDGWELSYLFPRVLWPLPDQAFTRFLTSGVRTLFVCELNATRQLAEMIRARYSPILIEHEVQVKSIIKDTGMPFTACEIYNRVVESLSEDISRAEGLPFSAKTIRERIFGLQPCGGNGGKRA